MGVATAEDLLQLPPQLPPQLRAPALAPAPLERAVDASVVVVVQDAQTSAQ